MSIIKKVEIVQTSQISAQYFLSFLQHSKPTYWIDQKFSTSQLKKNEKKINGIKNVRNICYVW